jgi:hypothetical protein
LIFGSVDEFISFVNVIERTDVLVSIIKLFALSTRHSPLLSNLQFIQFAVNNILLLASGLENPIFLHVKLFSHFIIFSFIKNSFLLEHNIIEIIITIIIKTI